MARTCSENGKQRGTTKSRGGRPEGKRNIGRPRLRWLDDDMNDLRNMGIRQLRKKPEDRQEGKGIVRETKVKLKRTVYPKKKKKKKKKKKRKNNNNNNFGDRFSEWYFRQNFIEYFSEVRRKFLSSILLFAFVKI
jgi:hypothetical protein